DEVPFKPELDFINTPMLKINKIRFNPNPTGATWIAVANSVGFIQFICLEQLYCKQFDIALNRKPTGKDSVYLESKPKEVISKPINNTPKPLRKKSQRRPRTTTTTTSNSKPKLPSSSTSSVQPVQIRIQSVNDNNNNDVTEDRREAISSDLSGDSDATEMMINDMQTLNIIENKNENARNRRRSRRLQSQQSTFNLSNSSTDPCQEP
uniref:Uncharacterized protein n=1 Tax=Trichobilharzia regenti TaxID=157069 RepID=A0AA85JBP9_TRIRE